jgi:pentatricopeptide repeat protein
MLENGHTPSRETYLYLIKASIAGGQFEQAPVWLEEMRKRGIEREIFTYNTLIRGYTERRRMQELEVVRPRTERFDLFWRQDKLWLCRLSTYFHGAQLYQNQAKRVACQAGVSCARQTETLLREKYLRAALVDCEIVS